MAAIVKSPAILTGQTDLERLKKPVTGGIEAEKARLRKATKEFESFFMYQMLKTMRKTVHENSLAKDGPLSGGLGKDMFTDMFDMEIARKGKFGGPSSISALLYKSLEKLVDARYSTQQADSLPAFKPLGTDDSPVKPLHENVPIPIPDKASGPLPIRMPGSALPLPREVAPRRVIEAPGPVSARPDDPIVKKYGPIIDAAARENALDSALIASVIKAESNGDPQAVSHAGAKGLMQLADSTAVDMKVRDVYDPEENIHAGSRYLRRMLDRFGDVETALAAYNAGPANVEKYGGMPPCDETRAYVRRVTDLARASSAGNPHATPKAGPE